MQAAAHAFMTGQACLKMAFLSEYLYTFSANLFISLSTAEGGGGGGTCTDHRSTNPRTTIPRVTYPRTDQPQNCQSQNFQTQNDNPRIFKRRRNAEFVFFYCAFDFLILVNISALLQRNLTQNALHLWRHGGQQAQRFLMFPVGLKFFLWIFSLHAINENIWRLRGKWAPTCLHFYLGFSPQMTQQRCSFSIAHKVSTTIWAFPKGSPDKYPLDTSLKVSMKMLFPFLSLYKNRNFYTFY